MIKIERKINATDTSASRGRPTQPPTLSGMGIGEQVPVTLR